MRLRTRRVVGALGVAVALAAIGYATLRPMPSTEVRLPLLCLICGDLGAVDAILNVILFVPLGAALVFFGHSVRRAVLVAFLATFAVESLQFTVVAGRDASLGDLITNTLGAALGAMLVATWRRWLRPRRRTAQRLAGGAALAALLVLALTAAALRPSVPPPPYYGQYAPMRLTLVPFDGQVHSFLVGNTVIPYGEVEGAEQMRAALLGGDYWGRVEVTTRSSPGERSDIVRVGSRPHSILAISRRQHDLLFRARVRAADWRLRVPIVLLRGAFPRPWGRYTLEGALGTRGWHLKATGAEGARTRDVPFSALMGWSFLLPFEFHLDQRLPLLNALWAVALVAPAAYWSAWAARRDPATGGPGRERAWGDWIWWLVPLTLTAVVALILPLTAGFPLAHPLETGGALAGAAIGALLAQLAMLTQRRTSAAEVTRAVP